LKKTRPRTRCANGFCGSIRIASSTRYRFHQAGEFGKKSVAGGLRDAAPVVLDRRSNHLPEHRPDPVERALLVPLDEAAIAHHVGREDRREPPLGPCRKGGGIVVVRHGRNRRPRPGSLQQRVLRGRQLIAS